MRWADNGAIVWGAALAAPFGLTAWLMRHEHSPLTVHARAHPYIAGTALLTLGLHFYGPLFLPDQVKYVDPFRLIATWLAKDSNQ